MQGDPRSWLPRKGLSDVQSDEGVEAAVVCSGVGSRPKLWDALKPNQTINLLDLGLEGSLQTNTMALCELYASSEWVIQLDFSCNIAP